MEREREEVVFAAKVLEMGNPLESPRTDATAVTGTGRLSLSAIPTTIIDYLSGEKKRNFENYSNFSLRRILGGGVVGVSRSDNEQTEREKM